MSNKTSSDQNTLQTDTGKGKSTRFKNRRKRALKLTVQTILVLALLLPLLLYAFLVIDRRTAEIRRYHQEMVALEKELSHSLEALGGVVSSASTPDKENRIPSFNQMASDHLSQDRVSIDRSIVLLDPEAPPPISNCIIEWNNQPGLLRLDFVVTWPITSERMTDDTRLRFQGSVDIGKVLDESRKVTNFDALLIADPRGDLVQKYGPDADTFSALPSFSESEWKKSFENTPDPDDPSRLFLPVASAIQRDYAGRSYTIFPRELVLRPAGLERKPLSCRSEAGRGQEVLRLRIVGLVQSNRLSFLNVSPSETLYWSIVLYYLMILFLYLELSRPGPAVIKAGRFFKLRVRPVSHVFRWIAVSGFALTLGVFLCMSSKIYNHQARIDKTLQSIAAEGIATAHHRKGLISRFLSTSGDQSNQHCPGLSRCSAIDSEGWMISYKFGKHNLQGRNVADRRYFREAAKEEAPPPKNGTTPKRDDFIFERIVSRASGLREIVVAKKQLDTHPAAAPKNTVHSVTTQIMGELAAEDLGLAFVGIVENKWNILFSSEEYRQADRNLLQQFSGANCLSVTAKNPDGGFCNGLLHGRPARILITDPSASRFAGSSQDGNASLKWLDPAGKVVVVSYSYLDRFETRLAAAMRVTLTLVLLALVFLTSLTFLFRKPIPSFRRAKKKRPSAVKSYDKISSSSIDSYPAISALHPATKSSILVPRTINPATQKDGRNRAQSIITTLAWLFGVSIGALLLCWSWSIEEYWQKRLSADETSAVASLIRTQCRQAWTDSDADQQNNCPTDCKTCVQEENDMVILGDGQPNIRIAAPHRLSLDFYQLLRPAANRFLEILPGTGSETQQVLGLSAKPSIARLPTPFTPIPSRRWADLIFRLLVAGGLVAFFLLRPAELVSRVKGKQISAGALWTFLLASVVLLFFRQELLAAISGLFGMFEKVHNLFEKASSKIFK